MESEKAFCILMFLKTDYLMKIQGAIGCKSFSFVINIRRAPQFDKKCLFNFKKKQTQNALKIKALN
jgi:hypothetical protein